ncbi:MAG: N-acetylmuramoyl-L-alanine amidase [Proteobacteria bacterium]|nr:N-acetylmuramoyl-L-alanine amidase [Pseudomonadota bacterium]MBU4298197.1 N-acetylmuramoyl-L-alanine amidase [Pseudomonadota bacterium]MCG2748114.1 N-acetylmuramoyl-L-alanine amidase [Desulfobulbaceae bacterium]
MQRNLFIFFSIIIFLLIIPSNPGKAWAESRVPDLIGKRIDLATYQYNNLTFNQGERSRDRWLRCVKSLRMEYHRDPGHTKAPFALFMLGTMYEDMYSRFHDPRDLTEAAGYYEDLALIFPKDNLADDALLNLGTICLEKKSNGKKAETIFARIIAVYPDGDMAQSAALMLRRMKNGHEPPSQPAVISAKKEEQSPDQPMAYLSQPIRFWSTKNYTRVVIEPSYPVQFKEAFLKADGDLPRRLYVDLFNSRIAPTFQNAIPIQDGLLRQLRGAQFDKTTVRVVLDTESVQDYKIFTLEDPFRVVIDVTGTKPKPQTPQKLPTLAEQFGLGVKTIVIDPGHGGKDPGALGISGLQEKDVVLKVAKKVAAILEKETAFKVLLTRDRDVFIPLEERTAIANTKEADLFVSIHANSAPNIHANGVETYFLSLATSREEMQAAARENAASASQISDLQKILQDLMQNSKIEESARLAGSVQGELVNGLNGKYAVKNLGVKKAPFIVLIGAQMPAILTEIAFLSNKDEVRRLQDDRYLEAIARYIAAGVRQYAANLNGL